MPNEIVKRDSLAVTPKYIETQKFRAWCNHYFNSKDKETYLNATKSALKVYNTEDYHTAGVIGHENLKKLKNLSSTICEELGYSYAQLMKIGLQKVKDGSFELWEKFMQRLGYFDAEPQQPQVVNPVQINNNNFSLSDEQLSRLV